MRLRALHWVHGPLIVFNYPQHILRLFNFHNAASESTLEKLKLEPFNLSSVSLFVFLLNLVANRCPFDSQSIVTQKAHTRCYFRFEFSLQYWTWMTFARLLHFLQIRIIERNLTLSRWHQCYFLFRLSHFFIALHWTITYFPATGVI